MGDLDGRKGSRNWILLTSEGAPQGLILISARSPLFDQILLVIAYTRLVHRRQRFQPRFPLPRTPDFPSSDYLLDTPGGADPDYFSSSYVMVDQHFGFISGYILYDGFSYFRTGMIYLLFLISRPSPTRISLFTSVITYIVAQKGHHLTAYLHQIHLLHNRQYTTCVNYCLTITYFIDRHRRINWN